MVKVRRPIWKVEVEGRRVGGWRVWGERKVDLPEFWRPRRTVFRGVEEGGLK